MEAEIKAALINLMDGITASDGAAIGSATSRLVDLASLGMASLHPQLVHFLDQRSYNKALQFLGGATDIPAGICGGGKIKSSGK